MSNLEQPSFLNREVFTPLSRWPFWLVYSWNDVKRPYGKTIFGPLALTIQISVWVLVIYLIFKDTLGAEGDYYAVYLAQGYPAFVFFQSCIVGGQGVLKKNAGLISNIRLPFLLFALRFTSTAFINLFFSQILLYGLLVTGFSPFSPAWIKSIMWHFAYFPLGVMITIFAAFLGVFFPNFMVFVGAVTRFLFFATPILWYAGARDGFRFLLAQMNPVSHYLNLVREPLLGHPIPTLSIYVYLVSLILVSAGAIIGLKYFSHQVILKL